MKYLTLPLLALGLVVIENAHADKFQFGAAIDILEALNVKEERQMDFGVIERPYKTVLVDMNEKSTLNSGTTAKYIDTSTLAAGVYRIMGSNDATISVSAVDVANIPGLTFKALSGSYNDGESSADIIGEGMKALSAPGQEGKVLVLGGQLEVDPSVEEGTYAPAFSMDVNYD